MIIIKEIEFYLEDIEEVINKLSQNTITDHSLECEWK